MTVLSVTEKIYNLFWNGATWHIVGMVFGIFLIGVGIATLLDNDIDYILGLVSLCCGLIICLSFFFVGIQEEYKLPYNTYEVTLDESVAFVDPINDDFKIEQKEGTTSIFTVTPRVETVKVPTFKVGEYVNTKEYVNDESN